MPIPAQRSGGAVLDSLDFLTDEQKAAAMKEWGPFPSVDTTFRQVLTWAKKYPHDPRIPEALHRAVRSARYGCTSGELSRQAFQLLHKRYPNSEGMVFFDMYFTERVPTPPQTLSEQRVDEENTILVLWQLGCRFESALGTKSDHIRLVHFLTGSGFSPRSA